MELNFTMQSSYLTPCIGDEYIEVRDGYNESANLLGVFCGRNISVIVRSSAQNLWIRKSALAGFGARTPTKYSTLQVLSSEITN